MKHVELIIDRDCPNAAGARQVILSALSSLHGPVKWLEWDRTTTDAPSYARSYGSPTILVNGQDVAGALPDETANACRLYGEGKGTPSVEAVMALLSPSVSTTASSTRGAARAHGVAGTLPAVGLALLPKLTCAACFPAYAAVLGSFGITLWNYTPYLFPMTLLSLAAVLFMLAYRARRRRGFAPFFAGLFVSTIIVVGKFMLDIDLLLYAGLGGLVLVSLWNAWPPRGGLKNNNDCSHCKT